MWWFSQSSYPLDESATLLIATHGLYQKLDHVLLSKLSHIHLKLTRYWYPSTVEKTTHGLTFKKDHVSQLKVTHFHKKGMNSDRVITHRRLYHLLQLARLPAIHKKRCHFNIAIFQVIFLNICLLIVHSHLVTVSEDPQSRVTWSRGSYDFLILNMIWEVLIWFTCELNPGMILEHCISRIGITPLWTMFCSRIYCSCLNYRP